MTPLDYIRRAYQELTGNKKKHGKIPANDFKLNQPVLLFGGLGLLALVLVASIFISLFSANDQTGANCAFKIPEENGPLSFQNTCVTLEEADTPSRQRLGLSNRKSLPRDRGMLFDFNKPQKSCMWMKDMHFNIDMIWLDEQRKIVAIKENISPDTFPAAFCGPDHARYVIEVNAGIVEQAGLEKGHDVEF